jgi:hypothetical protein
MLISIFFRENDTDRVLAFFALQASELSGTRAIAEDST